MNMESNLNTLLSFHKVIGSGNNRKERELKKEIAHLKSVADITDRVSGSNDVYYETFDLTNDHSVGKIDLAMVEDVMYASQDNLKGFKIEYRTTENLNVFEQLFKVGQEVSIIKDATNKYTGIIESFDGVNWSWVRIEVPNMTEPLDTGNYIICRSMAKIIDNKLHLYPTEMLEHDVRLNINLKDEEKAYTVVSWVEQETPMTLSEYTVNVEDLRDLIPIQNITATTSTLRKTLLSWEKPTDSRITKIEIYRSTLEYLDAPMGTPITTITDLNVVTFEDTLPTEATTYYYSLFVKSDTDKFYGSYVSYYQKDVTPTSPVTNIVTQENYHFMTDKITNTVTWTKPNDKDLSKVEVFKDSTLIYTGLGTSVTFETPPSHLVSLKFVAYDTAGNTKETLKTYTTQANLNQEYFGVVIDMDNADAQTSVQYIGNAPSVTPAQGSNLNGWENRFPYNLIKPCVMKNGVVSHYLDKNNYYDKVGGGASGNQDPTSQVMIEIPKVYWFSERIGNKVYIRVANIKLTNDFVAFAHTFNSVEKDKIYIGAYLSANNGLENYSNPLPTPNTFNVLKANYEKIGTGYCMFKYSALLLLQILYLVAYKNKDCQSALGKGRCTATEFSVCGDSDIKGFMYGDTVATDKAVKFLGIENMWGSMRQYVDGIKCNNLWQISIDTTNTGVYNKVIQSKDMPVGTLLEVNGDTYSTFLPSGNAVGSVDYNSHFFDAVEVKPINGVCSTSGYYKDNARTGVFSMSIGIDPNEQGNNKGSRVMYIPQ